MGTVDFEAFDADNHYYEAVDAFIRYLPPDVRGSSRGPRSMASSA